MSSLKTHSVLNRLQSDVERLRNATQYRRLENVRGIDLSSNDYLGLSNDLRLKRCVIQALESEKVGSTGSRLLSGNAPIWEELEAQFASFAGTESSIFFSSGYLANIGLLSSIAGPEDTFFSDAANHASIIDGMRLSRAAKVIFPHGDLDFLESRLRSSSGAGLRFIVVESVFSMDGDFARQSELIALAERYDAGLIVDEAHATGVFGPSGRGLAAALKSGRPECLVATIHTCGKALASMGAFVAGSTILCDFLLNRARSFIFSTALPPYMAAQIREAIGLLPSLDDRRSCLLDLAAFLRQQLREAGFPTELSNSQIVPVVLGSNEAAIATARHLVDAGFGVKAIRPPTVPPGTARLRLSLTSQLTREQLESFVEALRR